jgi:hypothetical protein
MMTPDAMTDDDEYYEVDDDDQFIYDDNEMEGSRLSRKPLRTAKRVSWREKRKEPN